MLDFLEVLPVLIDLKYKPEGILWNVTRKETCSSVTAAMSPAQEKEYAASVLHITGQAGSCRLVISVMPMSVHTIDR